MKASEFLGIDTEGKTIKDKGISASEFLNIDKPRPITESASDFLRIQKKPIGKPLNGDQKPSLIKTEGKKALGTLEKIGQVYPAAETAAHWLSMTYGLPTSGLAGLAALPFGLDIAGKVQEWLAKKLIYQPQSKMGQELAETSFYPFTKLEEIGEKYGKIVEKEYGPTAGAIEKTAIQAVPILIPGLKGIAKKGAKVLPFKLEKVKTPAEIAKTPESQFVKGEFEARYKTEGVQKLLEKPPVKLVKEKAKEAIPTLEKPAKIPEKAMGKALDLYLEAKKKAEAKTKYKVPQPLKEAKEKMLKAKEVKPKLMLPKKFRELTIKGEIKKAGFINLEAYKGEKLSISAKLRSEITRAKTGIPLDEMVTHLQNEGYIDLRLTPESFLDKMRTNPEFLEGGKKLGARAITDKKLGELTKQERKLREQIEHEPEAPPKGEYEQINAQDLPVGKNVIVIENKSKAGWDKYKVIKKDPFEIIIEDGETIKLGPLDKVEVLKKDIHKPRLVKPKKNYIAKKLKEEKGSLEHDFGPFKDEAKKALKYFGETLDYREVGYILKSGRMLDFSGKNQGGTPGTRSFDHREISFGIESLGGGTEGMIEFMSKTGAIRFGYYGAKDRFSPGSLAIDVVEGKFTEAQLKRISQAIQQADYANIEISNLKGDKIRGKSFDNPRPIDVIKFIRGEKKEAPIKVTEMQKLVDKRSGLYRKVKSGKLTNAEFLKLDAIENKKMIKLQAFKRGDRVTYKGEEWDIGFINHGERGGTVRLQKGPNAGDKQINYIDLNDIKLVRKKPTEATTLYAGIPIHKAGEIWTKNIGEPIWDNLVMKKVPKLLEKIPGGKAVNRAFLREYRGDLKDTAKYIHSMDDMKRAQAMGREYGIDLGKRLQAFPEEAQIRMGEYIRGELGKLPTKELPFADEAKFAMLDLGKQAVDTGMFSEKTFFKNAGRYMPRLYTSKEFQSLLTQFRLKKPNRLDLSRFKRRKDIPKAIREEMGEILTPGYPIAKGIAQLTHDIEMARFFNGIAQNKDWAVVKQAKLSKTGKPLAYKYKTYDQKTGKAIEHFGIKKEFKDPIPDGWKQLPVNKKLGSLSESYVHPEIFKDLKETIRIMERPERVWRMALGYWKWGKVIASPKTHVRNMMSNSILAHLGGLPMYEQPVYLTKAAIEMRKKGKYWEAARKEGGLEHTFTAGELNALFDQVEGQLGGIKAGSLPEKFGIIGNAWGKSKKAMKKAADLYQAEEQWFKMAKFIHNIERKKMGSKAAWADAEKWLFNYSKLSRFQEKFRTKWYGAPFATFSFKAMPRIAEAAIKTPWRFALPGAMIYALEKAAQRAIGDTPEEIKAKKALRPEWMQGEPLFIPNYARVPIVDDSGREHWLNLTYILPWGDIGEQGRWMGIPGGIMPFSQPFVKEPIQQILNYDAFFKEEIVPETELAGKTKKGKLITHAKLRGAHLARAMLPTPVMDVTKIIDAIMKKPDYRGRFRKPSVVLADVIAGVKMYPVDYTEQVVRAIGKKHPKSGFLARKIFGQIRTLAIKKQAVAKLGGKTDIYDKQIQEKIDQLKGLGKEVEEIGTLYKQTGLKGK